MYCTKCGQLNESGQFCLKCGNQLITASETASSNEAAVPEHGASTRTTEPAVYVEKAKTIGLMYGQYVRNVLKKPTQVSEQIDQSNFVNGLISLILFALILPFILFLGLKQMTSGIGLFTDSFNPSFSGVVIKSIIFLTVLLALVSVLIFLYTRQCKLNTTIRDVVARFGAFLTIPVAILIVALVAAIIQLTGVAIFLASLGIMGLLVAISLTIYSYKKDIDQGIDALYGILFTFIIMGIYFRIFGVEILSSLVYAFVNPFGL